MKEILGGALKLFIRIVIVNIISLLVVVSILSFITAVFSENVGYVAVGTKNGKSEPLYTYYYTSGEDTQLEQYKEQGYAIQTQSLRILPDYKKNIGYVVAQICTLLILIGFICPRLWDRGYKDRNMVRTGHQTADPLKGLKMGLIANIPIYLTVPLFALLKDAPTKVFKTLNAAYRPFLEFVIDKEEMFTGLSLWQMAIILLIFTLTPALAFLGYYLGYKDISISEKLVYKRR